MMTENELAYLAGIVDGEGHIALANKSKDKNGATARPLLSIGTTTIALVNWIQLRCPEVGFYTRKSKNAKHKDCHMLTWRSANAVDVIRKIYPWPVIKKQQARLLLDYSQWEQEHLGSSDLAETRKSAWRQIRKLNHRGPTEAQGETNV